MTKVISNTSPLLYLYQIGAIKWLPKLFDEIWTPDAVKSELLAGRGKGYDVPNPDDFTWLQVINPKYVVLLDDMLARRTAKAAGLQVWGTSKVLLEAKSQWLVDKVEPYVTGLNNAGMWVSAEVKYRILVLAGESE